MSKGMTFSFVSFMIALSVVMIVFVVHASVVTMKMLRRD